MRVIYDGEAIKLYVEGDKKAAALTKLLPTVKVWGQHAGRDPGCPRERKLRLQ